MPPSLTSYPGLEPEDPALWHVSFVIIALVGVVATTRILMTLRGTTHPTWKHLAAVALYLLVAVVGVVPDIGSAIELSPIHLEALLLIGLVLVGHGLVWEFFVADRDPASGLPDDGGFGR